MITGKPEGPDAVTGFPDVVRNERIAVAGQRAHLLATGGTRFVEKLILALCLLVNGIFFLARPDYIPLFIAASFYLNMFYFVSLLVPTSRSRAVLIKPDIARFFSWLQKIGLVPGTSRMTRLVMNAFFINSRALSAGICCIFSVDLAFSLIALRAREVPSFTLQIVILQELLIIIFYALVWKTEPFSTRFVRNVRRVKDRMHREKVPSWVITALFFSGFMVSLVLFITTIILLPGFTVSMLLSESGLSAIGYLVFLLATLALSQYFAVRFIHGISSRTIARRLFDFKEEALAGLPGSDGYGQDAGPLEPDDRLDSMTALLESKIYQVEQNSLAGLFPVFVVNPDFSVLMDSSILTAINGYIGEAPDY
ncbi:MAG TPA: hypothetical protein VEI81_05745 [Methanoregula sp.]|nr:hypothetical protein [Methanoregula sp.]